MTAIPAPQRDRSYGQDRLTPIDRLGVWLSRRPIEAVIHRYQKPAVLDLGCGYEAKLLRSLSGRIRSGVGVDVSIARDLPANVLAQQESIEQALGIAGTTSMPLSGSFDVILLISVLEHLWEPLPVLRACHELLAPGGSLVINVPNWIGKIALEFSAFRLGLSPAAEMDDHKMYYGKRDLWPLLVRAGFRPSRIRMRYHKLGLNLFAVASKIPAR